ncbi:MAG: malonyl-CoA decarboxylase [Pseudomonadota bacterium]
MTLLADLLSNLFDRRYDLLRRKPVDDDRPLRTLMSDLLSTSGETSGQALAQAILDKFGSAGDEEKVEFFRYLAEDLTINPGQVRKALSSYEKTPSKKTYRDFMSAAEPARQELIRRLNQAAGGTEALVAMRADLLRLSKGKPSLDLLDLDFRHLLGSWFNRGFLVLRPVNWSSPAHILEKIIAYEAVHAIDTWEELRRRLEPEDRRCFAFFHPAMPDEPLIFVEVALTTGTPGSIQSLLAEDREYLNGEDADTAAFYSISNCQAGLANISFGNSLIKQVAIDLSAELANLNSFVTLSPIPGFTTWLNENGLTADSDDEELLSHGARYLVTAKGDRGMPLDPVARFHLGNGAEIYRLNANGDITDKGMRQSSGLMVNYRYDLSRTSLNHERFASSGEIAMSADIRALSVAGVKKSA